MLELGNRFRPRLQRPFQHLLALRRARLSVGEWARSALKERETLWTILALVVIAGLAAGLRFYRLGVDGLWTDEIFTAIFANAQNDWAAVANQALSTPLPTPPLWFWITHAFINLLGESEFVVRLPAAIAGVLGVLAVYWLGSTLFDRSTGLVAALLLSLSPFHLSYSQEARFYPAIVLFACLGLIVLYHGIQTAKRKWWLGFTLISLLGLYTHLTTIPMLAVQVLYAAMILAADCFNARKLKASWQLSDTFAPPLLVSLGLIALGYLPMVPYILAGLSNQARGLGGDQAIPMMPASSQEVLSLVGNFGAGTGLPLMLYGGAFLLGLAFATQNHKRQAFLILLWVTVPFVIIFLLQPRHWFSAKYVIYILPVYLVAISWGLVNLARWLSERVISQLPSRLSVARIEKGLPIFYIGILVAVFALSSAPKLAATFERQTSYWQPIGRFLTANTSPQDAIAILPTNILTMSGSELLAYYCPRQSTEVRSSAQLMTLLESHRRVWLVYLVPSGLMEAPPPEIEVVLGDLPPHVAMPIKGKHTIYYLGAGKTGLTLLEEARAFDRLPASAWGAIGEAYRTLEMWPRAEAAYQQAAELQPENGLWSYHMATIYDKEDQAIQAAAAFQKAIDLQPERPAFHAALGRFYQKEGLPELALVEFQAALNLYQDQHPDEDYAEFIQRMQEKINQIQEILNE